MEIETGAGLGQILPDQEVTSIIEAQIIPSFRIQDFDAGVLSGT